MAKKVRQSGRLRTCIRYQCVPSKTGAQSEGCPPGQVKRCAEFK